MSAKKSVYEIVTERILDALAKGVVPWRRPWQTDMPRNLVSGREYRGVNVLLLSCQGFASPCWLTFKQAKALGGSVKKGEKGTPVIFWRVYDGEDENGKSKKRFVLRYFTVFNVEQCEGLDLPAAESRREVSPIAECEWIVAAYKEPPAIRHAGQQACYSPSRDEVRMPAREAFGSDEEYYSTLFHELTHSTGHTSRLARKGVTDPTRFGSHDYSFEELVAECGAAFLAARAGIAPKTIDNSAAYIASWTKRLTSEPRWIVDAAAQAAKAADRIAGAAEVEEDADEEDVAA